MLLLFPERKYKVGEKLKIILRVRFEQADGSTKPLGRISGYHMNHNFAAVVAGSSMSEAMSIRSQQRIPMLLPRKTMVI